jgi:hypothetical protein
MARITRVLGTVILVAVAACSDSTGPEAVPSVQSSANVTTGTGAFTADNIVFFPCVGEVVHTVVNAPYTFYRVTLPTGEYVYHDHWDTKAVTGSLVGQTSGTVWVRDRNHATVIDRSTSGGMLHFTFSGIFVSDTGPTLLINEVFHTSRNAAGEIVAERYAFNCRLAPN